MKWALLAALTGTATAQGGENCLGSANIEPVYCLQKDADLNNYCISQGIKPNDIVPLQVAIRNDCHYTESGTGTQVYVPAKLQSGKIVQIVFACRDPSCNTFDDDLFEYTNYFEPGPDPADEQAFDDWKDGGRVGPRPDRGTLGAVNCDPSTDATCRVSFTMGSTSGTSYGGPEYCKSTSTNQNGVAPDLTKACGYFKIHDDVRHVLPAPARSHTELPPSVLRVARLA